MEGKGGGAYCAKKRVYESFDLEKTPADLGKIQGQIARKEKKRNAGIQLTSASHGGHDRRGGKSNSKGPSFVFSDGPMGGKRVVRHSTMQSRSQHFFGRSSEKGGSL